MTVLKGCSAQSHIAHEITRFRGGSGPSPPPWPKAVSAAVVIGVSGTDADCSSLMLAVWRGQVNGW
ncbi:hypothetical protein GCM10022383_13630 [Microbacterium soli]|uniref:Uncharacterized protein n=1 Tax=Microbacterium soli TaxID=446075 RepID=A0ABP7N6H9_9MICO